MADAPGSAPSAAGRAWGPLLELTRARVIEFARDPAALFWVFGFPVVLAVALGVAFRESPEKLPRVAVIAIDAIESSDSTGATGPGELATDPAIVAALEQDAEIEVVRLDAAAAFEALRKTEVDLVVAPYGVSQGAARDAAQDAARGDQADVPGARFHFDPTQPDARLARVAVDAALLRGLRPGDARAPVATIDEPVTESGSRYIDFLLPGLIGLNLMASGMWGIGYAVVDTRKRHLLKRFAVTPMHRAHFLLSFMLSRMIFLVAEVVLLLLFGWLVFDVGVRGSLISVALVCLLGALSFTGIAILVAARPRSTEVAAGWINFVMMPMWLLSGTFFAYSRFPEVFQPFIRALPLTAFNDALRALMSDGTSLLTMPLELAVMAIWGVASFVVALRIFKWQ